MASLSTHASNMNVVIVGVAIILSCPSLCSLQDLDPPDPMTDDTDLLEEMALYEEQGEGLEEEGGVMGLSDSRNDDELILQMEELM